MRVEPAAMVMGWYPLVALMSTMLVTVEQRLMDIFFRVLTDLILLTWIQGTGYNSGCQNLFETFFKGGEEGFGLDWVTHNLIDLVG